MTLKGWFGVSKDQTPLLMEWCDMVASNFSEVPSTVKDTAGVWRQEAPGMLLHLRQPFTPDRQVGSCPTLGRVSRSPAGPGPCCLHLPPPPSLFHASPPPPDGSPSPPPPPHLRSASGEPLEISGKLEQQNLQNPRPC